MDLESAVVSSASTLHELHRRWFGCPGPLGGCRGASPTDISVGGNDGTTTNGSPPPSSCCRVAAIDEVVSLARVLLNGSKKPAKPAKPAAKEDPPSSASSGGATGKAARRRRHAMPFLGRNLRRRDVSTDGAASIGAGASAGRRRHRSTSASSEDEASNKKEQPAKKRAELPSDDPSALPSRPDPSLPAGWVQRSVPRKSNPERSDTLWFAPGGDRRFRSRAEARRYLAELDGRGGDEARAHAEYDERPIPRELTPDERRRVVDSIPAELRHDGVYVEERMEEARLGRPPPLPMKAVEGEDSVGRNGARPRKRRRFHCSGGGSGGSADAMLNGCTGDQTKLRRGDGDDPFSVLGLGPSGGLSEDLPPAYVHRVYGRGPGGDPGGPIVVSEELDGRVCPVTGIDCVTDGRLVRHLDRLGSRRRKGTAEGGESENGGRGSLAIECGRDETGRLHVVLRGLTNPLGEDFAYLHPRFGTTSTSNAKPDPRPPPPSTKSPPVRQHYNPQTNQPLTRHEWETDADHAGTDDTAWRSEMSSSLLDEFDDVTADEKSFMKLWNGHARRDHVVYDRDVGRMCSDFVRERGAEMKKGGLRTELVRHLFHLWDAGVVSSRRVEACLAAFDAV